MGNPSTTKKAARPPLDVYKKVSIIWKPTDSVVYEDSGGNAQKISNLSGEALTAAPLLQQKVKVDIPTPQIIAVENYETDVPPDYQVPHSYVRPRRLSDADEEALIEYSCDLDDEAWIERKTQKANKDVVIRPQLSLSLLERMLDILEKATGFETIIRLDQAEHLFATKLGLPRGKMSIVKEVYDYWVHKRCKMKKPLLRRFWPVTASNDTNPHLVFRPREKEKYKLRKKRQNDMDAFRKMQLLRRDFDRVRSLLDLVRRRERLLQKIVDIREDLFEQHIYDCVDTSGLPRKSKLDIDAIDDALVVPQLNQSDSSSGYGKKKKRKRDGHLADGISQPHGVAGDDSSSTAEQASPRFTQPLPSRETFVTSWDNAVPYVPSYVDAEPAASLSLPFRHRGRIGRGGRICIDRLPCRTSKEFPPRHVCYAGEEPSSASKPANTLLELLPPVLDTKSLRSRIAEICASWSDDDDAELVKVGDWIDTDEQLWGEERLAIGPI